MSISHGGGKLVTNGLISLIDPSNVNTTAGIGVTSPSFSPFKCAFDSLTDISNSGTSSVSVTNKSYFTCVGLTYPESSQAAPWTSRQGITPGIGVTSGTKIYDHSRDMGYYVYDEDTLSWVPDSEFNGERINGHCYDTYDGAPAQHATFQTDFDNIVLKYPNATHIIIGSHAAENNDNDAETLKRLQRIGLPNSHIGVGRPEYVLIGKVDRPNTWSYVRENINSGIGVMTIGLPLNSQLSNEFTFTGSNNLVASDNPILRISGNKTISCWVKLSATANCGIAVKGDSTNRGMGIGYGWSGLGFLGLAWNSSNSPGISRNSSRDIGKWCYVTATQSGGTRTIYVWDSVGVRTNTSTSGSHSWNTSANLGIGANGVSDSRVPSGTEIGVVKLYNRALTSAEVEQNFKTHRSRYGI